MVHYTTAQYGKADKLVTTFCSKNTLLMIVQKAISFFYFDVTLPVLLGELNVLML